jgi:plastocyanin
MNRFLRMAVAAVVISAAVAACSHGEDSGSAGASAGAGRITVQNFVFTSPVTVTPGATITVTNKDPVDHNVISDDAGLFETPAIQHDKSVTFTAPTAPGTYKFSCTFHPQMKSIGTLIVQG